jgi:flagellar basal body-associated protein FliL
MAEENNTNPEQPEKNLPNANEADPAQPLELDPIQARNKKIKKIVIIIVPILIIIAAGLYFFFYILKAPNKAHKNNEDTAQQAEIKITANTYLDLDQITVGLLPSSNTQEYLRIRITLKLATEQEHATVLTKVPVIKDALITFLRSLRSSDFNKSGSTVYLREEIIKRINKITAPVAIKEVLFQEITVK